MSRDYVFERLDGPYVNPDMALSYLESSGRIRTPFAYFTCERVSGFWAEEE